MKIETWEHSNVDENGICASGGAVYPNGAVSFSGEFGGCDLKGCDCSHGHFICFSFPRNENGVVKGVTIYFDNKIQMSRYVDEFIAESNKGKQNVL